jgi:hypothetical protein
MTSGGRNSVTLNRAIYFRFPLDFGHLLPVLSVRGPDIRSVKYLLLLPVTLHALQPAHHLPPACMASSVADPVP